MQKYFLILLFSILLSCNNQDEKIENTVLQKDSAQILSININPVWNSDWNDDENIDSPAFWNSNDGKEYVIATSKSKSYLVVYDALTGKRIKTIGNEGKKPGELSRPNGVWVIEDYLFVVERDNQRVQVFSLPEFQSIMIFGENYLLNPYGITITGINGDYKVFVTDNYETPEGSIPADSLLGERVKMFHVLMNSEEKSAEYLKAFGKTNDDGVLRVVESIYADPENNNLLIAEENEAFTQVYVYDMDGNYKGTRFGEGLFKYQVEGIALLQANNKGYWIITDQDKNNNKFNVFDRTNFKFIGSFNIPGVSNTDGIWLANEKIGDFNNGLFFACNNDGGIGAISIEKILKGLKLDNK